MPSTLKAWINAIVPIGLTFDLDPGRENPYIPLLADRPRRAVLFTSRVGHGFGADGALAAMNHADTALRDVLGFIGITDVQTIAVEHEEAGGGALADAWLENPPRLQSHAEPAFAFVPPTQGQRQEALSLAEPELQLPGGLPGASALLMRS